MLGKLLLLAGAIGLVLMLLRQSRKPKLPPQPQTDDMVQCAHCGVHLPEPESVTHDGKTYCSAAHRDAGR